LCYASFLYINIMLAMHSIAHNEKKKLPMTRETISVEK